jgi:hypothetical protein
MIIWQTIFSVLTSLFVSSISLTSEIFFFAAISSVVYDSVEPSPFYDNTPNDLYIDERDLIELPAASQQENG